LDALDEASDDSDVEWNSSDDFRTTVKNGVKGHTPPLPTAQKVFETMIEIGGDGDNTPRAEDPVRAAAG
jgi:hypothetical protein